MRSSCIRALRSSLVLALVVVGAAGCKKQLVVEIVGTGTLTLPNEELSCAEPTCTFELAAGEHTFVAAPGERFAFAGYEGLCTSPASGTIPASCTANIEDSARLKARFDPLIDVTVTVEGDGRVQSDELRVNCPPECKGSVRKNTEVRFRRTAGKDMFVGFEGDCVDKKECTMIALKDANVVAKFAAPYGTPILGTFAGAVHVADTRVALAVDEKGGIAVAAVNKGAFTVTRFDVDGKQMFSRPFVTGKTSTPPALAFFGDDVLVIAGDDTSSTIVRYSPDGKEERYKKLHKGCPGLSRAVIQGDALFAAGTFKGSHSCKDIELISSGGHDVYAVRIAVDDGGLTWAAQIGSKQDDRLNDVVVTIAEEMVVGWTAGLEGGRITRINPAGKPFPDLEFGKPSSTTEILALSLGEKDTLRVAGHVLSQTEFGTDVLGPPSKDGAPRLVTVVYEASGRVASSLMIGRSTCDSTAVCAFDAVGGFLRVGTPLNDGEDTAVRVVRAGQDGTERWSTRIKGTGKGAIGSVAILPTLGAIVTGTLEGTLELEPTPLDATTPQAFLLRLKD